MPNLGRIYEPSSKARASVVGFHTTLEYVELREEPPGTDEEFARGFRWSPTLSVPSLGQAAAE